MKKINVFTKINSANLSGVQLDEMSMLTRVFRDEIRFSYRNGDEIHKFREICYQTDVVCRRKPRIVEGIRRERQGIPAYSIINFTNEIVKTMLTYLNAK